MPIARWPGFLATPAISSPWKRWWRRSSATSWKFILFVDDNITANPDRAKELFEALIPLKVPWASQASIDMVSDWN